MEKLERINKYLSESGVCSRREVDELIETGRVEVNHQPARIGMQIDTQNDKVYVDGQLVDPNHKEKNAVSKEAMLALEERPWWMDHNEEKQAREEALMQNPKSKLLRHGRKNSHKTVSSAKGSMATKESSSKTASKKTLSELKEMATRAAAIKTRGHSSAEKQAKNQAVQAANKEVAAKEAKRDELRRPKTFGEVFSNLSNPQRTLKERRVEGVNPKAAQLRGKKSWSGASRRTRHK